MMWIMSSLWSFVDFIGVQITKIYSSAAELVHKMRDFAGTNENKNTSGAKQDRGKIYKGTKMWKIQKADFFLQLFLYRGSRVGRGNIGSGKWEP